MTERHRAGVPTPVTQRPQREPDDRVPLLLTVTAAAGLLGISRTTLYRELDAGAIAYKRIGSDRRIAYSELVAYTQRDLVKAEQP